MIQTIFIWLSFCFLLLACAKNDGTSDPDASPVLPKPPVDAVKSRSCYQETNPQVCLDTESLLQVRSLSEDYDYLTPSRENGFPSGFSPVQYRKPLYLAKLNDEQSNPQLSEHFRLSELMTERKGPFGIFSSLALNRIEKLRQAIGSPVIVTSGYRSPGYNSRISGAARWSRHTYGDAIDFYSPGADLELLAATCSDLGASFTQTYSSHVHCDWRNERLDESYYGESQLGPQTNWRRSLERQIQIDLESVGNVYLLSASFAAAEDNAELTYLWHVSFPDGEHRHFANAEVLLDEKPSSVEVVIGGSLRRQKSFSR